MSKEIIYLIGLPASGKSFFLKKNYPHHVVISNDLIVEKYAKKWKTDYNKAWQRLDFKVVNKECRQAFEKAVHQGKNIVIDNTNMTVKSRRKYIADGYDRVAVVFNISDAELAKRTEKRKNETGKLVPPEAIENMKRIYQPPTEKENFREIISVKA